jgi:phosphohistidine swiveling domain-containing protein
MKWTQFYKVDLSILTAYLEAVGNRYILPKLANLPGIPYKYIGGMIYFREKELKDCENEIRKNPLHLAKEKMSAMVKVSDAFVEICQNIDEQDYSKKSIHQLKDYYKKFYLGWKDFLGLGSTPLFFENIVEEMLKKELAKHVDAEKEPEKFEKYLNSVVNLTKDTFGIKEKKEFYRIAEHIFRNKIKDFEENAEVKKLINQHLEKWAWIKVHLLLGEPMSRQDLIDRLQHSLEKNPSEELKKIIEEKERYKEELKKTLSDLPQLKEIAEVAQLIIYVRDYRYALACKGCFYIRKFLRYLSGIFDLTYEDIVNYLPDEVEELLDKKKKVSEDIVKQRKDNVYALVVRYDEETFAYGDDYERIKQEEEQEIGRLKEFSGVIASKGKAKGVVKIVLTHEDLKKINKGDILVAQQTIPDFVPSMEKTSAIITDLGGITSHAAIVSRELGIPCIVGTKIATKVLNEDDIVEVDAEKGIIRRLK